MRNLDTPVKQIRRKIFTEIAKIGFEFNEKILIYVNSEHFAVETLMDGFEIMSEYLLKNVDPDKIIYINKK